MSTRRRLLLTILSSSILFWPWSTSASVKELSAIEVSIPFVENQGQIEEPNVLYYARTDGGTVFVTQSGDLVYSLSFVEKREGGRKLPPRERAGGSWAIRERFMWRAGASRPTGEAKTRVEVNEFKGSDRALWKSGLKAFEFVNLGEICEGIEVKLRVRGKSVEKLFYLKPRANPSQIEVVVEGAKRIRLNPRDELELETDFGPAVFTKPMAYQEIEGERVPVEVSYRLLGSGYGFKLGPYDRERPLIIDPLLASTFLGTGHEIPYKVRIDAEGHVYVVGHTCRSDFPTTIGAYDRKLSGDTDIFVAKFDSDLKSLLAATFLGGSGSETWPTIAFDTGGHVYVVGGTNSSDFPTTSGAYDRTYNGGSDQGLGDLFISKLSANLSTLLASTYLGGSGAEGYQFAYAIALDRQGNVYVASGTLSHDFPTTAGAYQRLHYDLEPGSPTWDAFVSKLDGNLTTLVASTYLGGKQHDVAYGLSIDEGGNVFVCGRTLGEFPTTPGAYSVGYSGAWDGFVSKLNGNLSTLLASTYLGGEGMEFIQAIALSSTGDVYVAGTTYSHGFPTTPDAPWRTVDDVSGFVSKLDPALSQLLSSTVLYGHTEVNDLALGFHDDVYICGEIYLSTSPSDIYTHEGAYSRSIRGPSDAYIVRFESDLSADTVLATALGGSGQEWANGISIDGFGNVYVVGDMSSGSSDFPTTPGAYDRTYANPGVNTTGFVSKFTASLTADSAPVLYTIEVVKEGHGTGIVTSSPSGISCGASCIKIYPEDTWITLTATPGAYSTFAGWSHLCSGTGTCSVLTVPDDYYMLAVAKFLTEYPVSVTKPGDGGGTVASTPAGISCGVDCSRSFLEETRVRLEATSDGDSIFSGWSEACSGTDPVCTVTMDGPKNVTAQFLLKQYELSVLRQGTGSGTVTSSDGKVHCGLDCGETYGAKTSVSLTAVPNPASVFDHWEGGGCSGTTPSCTLTMDANRTVNAYFTFSTEQYLLSVSKSGTGTGTVSSSPSGIDCGAQCSQKYLVSTPVSLTAVPSSDSIFLGWSGACSGGGTCHVFLDSDKSVKAIFSLPLSIKYTLTVSKAGKGSGTVMSSPEGISCGSDCSQAYMKGTSVALVATPSEDSAFAGWAGACTGTASCTVKMNSNLSVTATFLPLRYKLSVTKSGNGTGKVKSKDGGIVCGSDCSERYADGALVPLLATPDPGMVFSGWEGACLGMGDCTVTMRGDQWVQATFNVMSPPPPGEFYLLRVSKTGTGSCTIIATDGNIDCGTNCSQTYEDGAQVGLTVLPHAYSVFSGWSGACTGTGTCDLTMDADKEVIAKCKKSKLPHYLLQVMKTGRGDGTVTSSPGKIVCGEACKDSFFKGETVVLTAEPDENSYFKGWEGCLPDGENPRQCTVTVKLDSTVVAKFKIVSLSVEPNSVDFGTFKTEMKFTISNKGSNILTWSLVNDLPSWLTAAPMGGSLLAKASKEVTLTVNRSVLPTGSYNHTISVISNGGEGTVEVGMRVEPMASAWAKTYAGPLIGDSYGYEDVRDIKVTNDGGYVVAGLTASFGAGNTDYWVIKLSGTGNIEWERTYGGMQEEQVYAIQQTPDGGYLVAGESKSFGAGGRDIWILKLQSNGTVEWQKSYGGEYTEQLGGIINTVDSEGSPNGYLVVGSTNSFGNLYGYMDIWLLKLRFDGTIEWERTFGGWHNEYGRDVQQTPDGGYIVIGDTQSFGATNQDLWVLKLNSTGSIEWQKRYGGTGSEIGVSVQTAEGDGYVLGAYTNSFGAGGNDFWVLKVDALGEVEWQKTYGSASPEYMKRLEKAEGGYVAIGWTEHPIQSNNIWVVKLSATGSIDWQKMYNHDVEAAPEYDRGYAIQQTGDGGYIAAGLTNWNTDNGNGDIWILKLAGDGALGCGIDVPTSVSAGESAASGLATEATMTTSLAIVTDSSATVTSTSAIVATQCGSP